jgi:hypothetical protein
MKVDSVLPANATSARSMYTVRHRRRYQERHHPREIVCCGDIHVAADVHTRDEVGNKGRNDREAVALCR